MRKHLHIPIAIIVSVVLLWGTYDDFIASEPWVYFLSAPVRIVYVLVLSVAGAGVVAFVGDRPLHMRYRFALVPLVPLAIWFTYFAISLTISAAQALLVAYGIGQGFDLLLILSAVTLMYVLIAIAAWAGCVFCWYRSHGHLFGATKPVEPTGISSFPSDPITSHPSGDSPGGSLRR